MQRRFGLMTLAALWVASLGTLLPAEQAAAADRRSTQTADSPYAMPGTVNGSDSTSSQSSYQADYHADYRLKSAPGSTEDATQPRQERRNDSRDTRDWRSAPGTDRYGRTPYGLPR